MVKVKIILLLCVILALLGQISCQCGKSSPAKVIKIDGSSTVFPINEAIAEEFQKNNKVKVIVGTSGTGGGFEKFCRGEINITGASRPIKQSEIDLCVKNNINYIELPIAYDGIAIVVNKKNTWVDFMTVKELKKLWEPDAQEKITHWHQIRKTWPNKEIHLFAPGIDSGTYDYFTKVIVGIEHSSRGDITSSEDDNVLVKGVSNDEKALGFFGYAYYKENKNKLKIVPIKKTVAKKAIVPTLETIKNNSYNPLSRPVFIYVSKDKSSTETNEKFINFYLNNCSRLAQEVGFVPLDKFTYKLVKQRFVMRKTGSYFLKR